MSTVIFHSLLRRITGDRSIVVASATTVEEVIEVLAEQYGPKLKNKIISEEGELSPFVSIFLNDRDIRTLGGLPTPVKDDDELSILPSVAGG